MKYLSPTFRTAFMPCLFVFCLATAAVWGGDKGETRASRSAPAEQSHKGNETDKGWSRSPNGKITLVRYFACRLGLLAALIIQQDESNDTGIEMLRTQIAETAIILDVPNGLLGDHLFNAAVPRRKQMEFVKRILPELIEIHYDNLTRSAYEMGMYIGIAKALEDTRGDSVGNTKFFADVLDHAIRAGKDAAVNSALMQRLTNLKQTLLSAKRVENLRAVEPAYRGLFIETLTNKSLFEAQ
jgi:hypothetical protein